MVQSDRSHRFGVFELHPDRGELRKHGIRIKLQQQPLQILGILLERPGEVVTRDDIQKRLWPDATFLAFDNAINSSIRKVREALGDTAENPRFVETLSRRGYRFIAPVVNQSSELPSVVAVATIDALPSLETPEPTTLELAKPIRRHWFWSTFALTTLCVLAATIFWFKKSASSSGSVNPLLTAVPFTSYPGYEVQGTFSPDGTRVAFAWQRPGDPYPDVYVKLVGPGEPVRVSKAGGAGPAWSPDGRFLAYLRPIDLWNAAVVVTPVVVTPVVAWQEREIAEVKCMGIFIGRDGWDVPAPILAWSPDGKWLLAIDQDVQGSSQPHAIVRISVETGEKRKLTAPPRNSLGDGGLALAPDGTRLAFTEDSGLWARDIYVVPVDNDLTFTGKPERITSDRKVIAGLAWTHDGKSLIFSSRRGGNLQLWRVTAQPGSSPSRLGLTDDAVTDASISTDGKHLLYAREIDDQNLWRASMHNGRVNGARSFISSTRRDTQARYSPDGTRIAFESDRSGNEEIWVVNADGSNPMQLTNFDDAWAGAPSWSPDGKKIAFAANAAGEWDIYVINSVGGKPKRLTREGADESWPTWSRDGKWMYYFSNRFSSQSIDGQIWKMPASGGAEVQVTKDGALWSNLSVNGSDLYYVNQKGICKIPASGGNEVIVAETFTFVPAINGIYFIKGVATQQSSMPLMFLDFETQKQKTVGMLPGPAGWNIEVSPDSQFFLYSKFDRRGSELMLVDHFQ